MTRLYTATALGVILASTPALAEITPSSVWEQLNSYYGTMGLTVKTDAVEEAGDTVTVRGLVLSQVAPEGAAEAASVEARIGDLVLTAAGDGGVTVDMPDQSTMTVTMEVPKADPADDATTATDAAPADAAPAEPATDAAPADAAPAEPATDAADTDEVEMGTMTIDLGMSNPGEKITVREDNGGNVYEYLFPTFELNVTKVETADGKVLENLGKMTLTNFAGKDRFETGESFKIDQNGTAESLAVDFNYSDDKGAAVVAGKIANLAYTSSAVVPPGTDMGPKLNEAMKAGLDVKGGLKTGPFDIKLDVTSPDAEGTPKQVVGTSSSDAMTLDFLMAEGRLGYSGTVGKSATEFTVPDLPFPIAYAADGAQFNIEMPVTAAPEPQPFTFVYGFSGLTLSDGIWGMFDPQSLLPRDPANIMIDLSGTARLDVDVLDPEAMADPSVAPGAVNTLKINKVDVSAVGANISATGDLTSPEGGDLSTPIGKITGKLTGINALLDKLGQAGLLPEDQAMGTRMMLTMFTKADPANPDVLTSEIEFKEGGQIFANGQQVK